MAATSPRDARLRHARARRATLTDLGRQFSISRTRVVQILEHTGGDPLASAQTAHFERATVTEIEAEVARLRDRIASDRRRLRGALDELGARQIDRILGFG